MLRVLGWLLVLETLALAQPTPAQIEQARTLFEDGRALAAQKHYDDACDKFEKSLALNAVFSTQLNLADCEEHRGHLAAAWHLYDDAAAKDTSSTRAEFARDHADKLAAKLATATIKLSDPSIDGMVVKVNGESVDPAAKITAMVDPGEIVVQVDVPGHKRAKRKVTAEPGEHVTIVFTTKDGDQGSDEGAGAGSGTRSDNGRHTRIVAAKSLLIGGGVLFVISGAIGLYEYNVYNQQFSGAMPPCMNKSNPVCTSSSGSEAIKSAISGGNKATVIGVIGIAAAGVGAVLYFTAPNDVVVAPAASGDSAGISISGTF
jgi:hypothetical protein